MHGFSLLVGSRREKRATQGKETRRTNDDANCFLALSLPFDAHRCRRARRNSFRDPACYRHTPENSLPCFSQDPSVSLKLFSPHPHPAPALHLLLPFLTLLFLLGFAFATLRASNVLLLKKRRNLSCVIAFQGEKTRSASSVRLFSSNVQLANALLPLLDAVILRLRSYITIS